MHAPKLQNDKRLLTGAPHEVEDGLAVLVLEARTAIGHKTLTLRAPDDGTEVRLGRLAEDAFRFRALPAMDDGSQVDNQSFCSPASYMFLLQLTECSTELRGRRA